ncbi:MAG: VanW family protein [Patescibacteria group bacterium]
MSDTKKTYNTATMKAIATWAGVTLGVLALFVLAVTAGAASYGKLHEGKIFPGVRVLNVRLDGLTHDEARQAVQSKIDESLGKGISFRFNGKDATIDTTISAADGSVSRELIQYEIGKAIDKAYGIGRSSGPIQNALIELGARLHPIRVPAEVIIDEKGISDELTETFHEALSEPSDATFDIHVATGTTPLVSIVNEHSGVRLTTDTAMKKLRAQAESLSFSTIELEADTIAPSVTRSDLDPLEQDVLAYINRPTLVFTYDNKSYPIATTTLIRWITVADSNGKPSIALSRTAFTASLNAMVPGINQETKNGSLDVQDGKIVSFTAGTQGYALDAEKTLAPVDASWPASSTFPLVVNITSGSLLGEDPERLGIKEIIGVGHSNFSGSPSNRRKNIAKGASLVNGTLIAPGEEFSLLKALGEIDGAHGWLQELVIKGNKTQPEYGGGLCQIGTTTFRAALSAGLKISERRNHSYRVRYYEPAGTDATIYDPSPDLRFVNDTNHYILINATIVGDEATFEVWGTKDGRSTLFKGQTDVTSVDSLKPRVYNVTSPPAMKLVETLDLPPGQKKCTEIAHAGADADFDYLVTYANGTSSTQNFASHYRPWQAVCLIGVEKLTAPPDTTTDEPGVN